MHAAPPQWRLRRELGATPGVEVGTFSNGPIAAGALRGGVLRATSSRTPDRKMALDLLSVRREKSDALILNDPQPVGSVDDIWDSAAPMAMVGIFVLLLVAALYFARPILLPVLAAIVIGTTCAPLIKRARAYGSPPWLTAIVLVALMMGLAGLLVTLLAAPIVEWIGRAPEIGASIKQKLYVLDRPLAALRDLQDVVMPSAGNTVAVESSQIGMVTPVLAFVTPAMVQIALFGGTLLFVLAGQMEFRRYMASLFSSREGKLRFIRIANDIEGNLASYVAIMTVINLGLGAIVATGAWAFGLANPVIFGVLAMVLNYLPYIGPACMAVVLFGVGLVTFSSLGQALLVPACFVALTTIEGQIITPTVLGRHLTLNPLAVFLSLAFWAWLWGPMGAFLAVPLAVVGFVIFEHVFPSEDPKLPG
jgi:predicted PurR-regulated permease PerM